MLNDLIAIGILVIVYGICDAINDTLLHHYYISIFKKFNEKFWNPNVSWDFAYRIPFFDYPIDAWHLVKSFKICCIDAAICVPLLHFFNPVEVFLIFVCIGVFFILVFNLFYNIILEDKEED